MAKTFKEQQKEQVIEEILAGMSLTHLAKKLDISLSEVYDYLIEICDDCKKLKQYFVRHWEVRTEAAKLLVPSVFTELDKLKKEVEVTEGLEL